jgi:hypothetical protein
MERPPFCGAPFYPFRAERGTASFVFFRRGEVWLQAIEKRLGRWWQSIPGRHLAFISEQTGKAAQGFLVAQGFCVWLFVARCNDSCAKEAISNAIARTTPSHAVIDDIGVHGPILPNLANLYPSVSFENGEGCFDRCDALHTKKAGKGFVGYNDGIILPDPCRQQVHYRRRFWSFCDESCPSLMRGAFCLNPVSSCVAVLLNYLLHCLPQAKFLAISANLAAIITGDFRQINGDFTRQIGYP